MAEGSGVGEHFPGYEIAASLTLLAMTPRLKIRVMESYLTILNQSA